MVSPFDAVFGGVASDLVSLFGVQQGSNDANLGSYTSIGFGRVDPSTGSATNPEDVQTLDMSPPISFKIGDLVPGTVEAGDCKVLVDGRGWDAVFPSVQPKVSDVIKINGRSFRVINPNPIYSGNQVAVYKMQVREGHA